MKLFLCLLLFGLFLPASSGAVNAQGGGLSEMMCKGAATAVDRENNGATATQIADRYETEKPQNNDDQGESGSVQ